MNLSRNGSKENLNENDDMQDTNESPATINNSTQMLEKRTARQRMITTKDLGGVFDTLIPIFNWDRFLEAELTRFNDRIETKKIERSTRRDFKFITIIGKGSYATVALVIKRDTNRYYAAKFISKKVLKHNNMGKNLLNERNILFSIRFTFTMYLEYFIQDIRNMYFILPIALGGNLGTMIKQSGKLCEKNAQFYAAQLVLAVEYLHYMNLIFRDLKPENVLLDHYGFVKLTDFGFCKILKNDKTYTLCGTPEYLAPEIIIGEGYDQSADWWSLGVVIYKLCSGVTPFRADSRHKIYQKICSCDYQFPNYFTDSLQMLLWNIFQLNPKRRYGGRINGVKDIKDHEWLRKIHWLSLVNRKVDPPIKPVVNMIISADNPSTTLNMSSK